MAKYLGFAGFPFFHSSRVVFLIFDLVVLGVLSFVTVQWLSWWFTGWMCFFVCLFSKDLLTFILSAAFPLFYRYVQCKEWGSRQTPKVRVLPWRVNWTKGNFSCTSFFCLFVFLPLFCKLELGRICACQRSFSHHHHIIPHCRLLAIVVFRMADF